MRIVVITALLVALTHAASAQEISIYRSVDTLTLRDLVFPAPENPLWQPQTFLPINPTDSVEMANLPPGYLRSEMLSLPMAFGDHFDLSSSLKLQWNKEDRYGFLRSALGYMLVGGEAYMVYRALKKYRYIH